MKKTLAIFGSLLLSVGVLTACGETEVEDVSDKKASSEATEKKEEKTEDKVYTVGDTVKVDGLEITLTSAKYTNPAEYSETKKGKVLTIEVQTNNTNDEATFIDNTDFSIYDTDGNKQEDYFGYDEMAISGDINSGKKLAGKLYFDVPEGKEYELIYTPTFSFDSKEIKFKVVPQ